MALSYEIQVRPRAGENSLSRTSLSQDGWDAWGWYPAQRRGGRYCMKLPQGGSRIVAETDIVGIRKGEAEL